MTSEPAPEPKPLMTTISSGSLWEMLRVQLFSSPQQVQASSTRTDPVEKEKLLRSSTLSTMLATVTRAMAPHSRGEMRSPNNPSAIREVATISKLFSRAALAAVVRFRPSISRMGAAMSSTTMPMV